MKQIQLAVLFCALFCAQSSQAGFLGEVFKVACDGVTLGECERTKDRERARARAKQAEMQAAAARAHAEEIKNKEIAVLHSKLASADRSLEFTRGTQADLKKLADLQRQMARAIQAELVDRDASLSLLEWANDIVREERTSLPPAVNALSQMNAKSAAAALRDLQRAADNASETVESYIGSAIERTKTTHLDSMLRALSASKGYVLSMQQRVAAEMARIESDRTGVVKALGVLGVTVG